MDNSTDYEILAGIPNRSDAEQIKKAMYGYFGFGNVRIEEYKAGNDRFGGVKLEYTLVAYNHGCTWAQLHKFTTFAIGVSWGLVAQRGF